MSSVDEACETLLVNSIFLTTFKAYLECIRLCFKCYKFLQFIWWIHLLWFDFSSPKLQYAWFTLSNVASCLGPFCRGLSSIAPVFRRRGSCQCPTVWSSNNYYVISYVSESKRQFDNQDSRFHNLIDSSKWLYYVASCIKESVSAADKLGSGTFVVLQGMFAELLLEFSDSLT